jgi:hypothetical protein
VERLIALGVIRAGGHEGSTGNLIPSHEIARIQRAGFIPFTERKPDPQTYNQSHSTAVGHLIAAATQSQQANRRLKALRDAESTGDTETVKRIRAEADAYHAERVRQFKKDHNPS